MASPLKVIPLLTLKTDKRTFRYGKDQYGGGSSGQPYVKKQLVKDFNDDVDARLTLIGGNGRDVNGIRIRAGRSGGAPDFLLREGSLQASIEDASRLTQLLLDPNPVTGPLFIAKQNLLSLANTNMSAGYKAYEAPDDSNINIGGDGRVGNFLTNAANSVVDFARNNTALNQGIYSPLGTIAQAGVGAGGIHLNKQGLNPFAPTNTSDNAGFPTYLNTIATAGTDGNKSRLDPLLKKQIQDPSNLELYKYKGGPGSILGVGKTIISIGLDNQTIRQGNSKVFHTGFGSTTRFVLDQQLQTSIQSVIKDNGGIINFTQVVRDDPQNPSAKLAIPKSIDYARKNVDLRTNLGNPGKKGNISSYAVGKRPDGDNSTNNSVSSIEGNAGYDRALDKINALPIYRSSGPDVNKPINDLVKFRIAVIDNNNPSFKTYIHFRAFIDSMSDSFTSDWEAQKFMGRGENFYKYSGFDRSISLSWTVAAQSKQELIPMYQKLNYLASVCAPDYSDAGYMRGNLISLTVGGWCYEQVGIMKGITLDVPTESPWEIGINDEDNTNDSSVKELPMIVKVTGFQFTPIHNFVPKVQQNRYGNKSGFVSRYGKEQYVALAAASGNDNNYDGGENNWNYIPNKEPLAPVPPRKTAEFTPVVPNIPPISRV